MKAVARRPAAVLMVLTLVGLVLVGLPGCAERPPPPPPVSAGMTRAAIRAVMGEPTSISQEVANGAKGMGPGMGYWNKLPVGARVEVWQYVPACTCVYFRDDSDTADFVHSTYVDPDTTY